MKSLSLRTASAKQRGLALVFLVSNSLRQEMREWKRTSSKCKKAKSPLLLLLIKILVQYLCSDPSVHRWCLVYNSIFFLPCSMKRLPLTTWQLRVSVHFQIFCSARKTGWLCFSPCRAVPCRAKPRAVLAVLTCDASGCALCWPRCVNRAPPAPSCKVKFNWENWSTVSGA